MYSTYRRPYSFNNKKISNFGEAVADCEAYTRQWVNDVNILVHVWTYSVGSESCVLKFWLVCRWSERRCVMYITTVLCKLLPYSYSELVRDNVVFSLWLYISASVFENACAADRYTNREAIGHGYSITVSSLLRNSCAGERVSMAEWRIWNLIKGGHASPKIQMP